MRVMAFSIASLLVVSAASGQVQLVIRRDGSKVISNVGSTSRGTNLGALAKLRNRRSAYDAAIERYSTQYGVDPVLVRAVIQVESDFNPNCVSNKGARGLMQLMPETAKRFGVKSVHDPEQNIRGGVEYLSKLLSMFRSDLPQALAAYNAGEGAVSHYSGIPPYEETMTYVKRALTVYYGRPYGAGSGYGFAGGGRKLAGGFKGTPTTTPQVAAASALNVRYLGNR